MLRRIDIIIAATENMYILRYENIIKYALYLWRYYEEENPNKITEVDG